MSKYADLVGRFHLWKESAKEKWSGVKEEGGAARAAAGAVQSATDKAVDVFNGGDDTYDHMFRRKSRWELTRISAAVAGIEFSYAAETAFVSPTLLKIGEFPKIPLFFAKKSSESKPIILSFLCCNFWRGSAPANDEFSICMTKGRTKKAAPETIITQV